jgi:hypothetical protein
MAALALLGCTGAPGPGGAPAAGSDRATAPWNEGVVQDVLRMKAADQDVRARAVALMQAGPDAAPAAIQRVVAEQDALNRAHASRLEEIIDAHGWPMAPQVTDEVAGAVFLLVQHATHDLEFQKKYLAFLEAEHAAGRGSGEALALLTDRTRQADGKPQLYGTQLSIQEGRLVLDPIEDEGRVDERRAALGLPPLAVYLEQARAAFGAGK